MKNNRLHRGRCRTGILLMCSLAAVLFVLSGCTTVTSAPPQTAALDTPSGYEAFSASAKDTLHTFLEPIKLPQEYLITYEVRNENAVWQVVKGQDADGRIYFRSGDVEHLYVPVTKDYQFYERDESGAFVVSGSSLYTTSSVDAATSEFTEYAEQSSSRYNGVATLTAEKEIAGRTCDVYNFQIAVVNFVKSYSLAVDPEISACLEWIDTQTISGHASSTNVNFLCTEFLTEQITLPVD